MRIRRAEPRDVPMLGRLGALLVQTHHDFDARRFVPVLPETEQGYGAYLRGRMDDPDTFVLVAEDEGTVIGYAFGGVEGPDWMELRGPAGVLYDIIVDPAHRAHGVGKQLLHAALAELETRGAPQVVLATAVQNEAAQRLFATAGFRPTMIEMTRERDA